MKELEHTEQLLRAGDKIRLRFPGDEFADVVVVSMSEEHLTIVEREVVLRFVKVLVPFNLRGTVLGDVCGELKMWKSVDFPNSPPAMIVPTTSVAN